MDPEIDENEREEGSEGSSSSLSLHTIPDIDSCMIFMDAFDYVDPAVNTGLIGATRLGDVDSVRRLIELGCELNNNDNMGNTALHIAAATGNAEIVRLLLRQPSIRLDVRNHAERTPLHLCSSVDVAAALLSAGCDVDALDALWNTPLHGVLTNTDLSLPQKLDCARLLLSYGAEVNTTNVYRDTPLSDLVDRFGDDPEMPELFYALVYYGADLNEPVEETTFLRLLRRRRFDVAALVAGHVHDFASVAEALSGAEDVRAVYEFAGEFFDDRTCFALLSRAATHPDLFASCWKVRSCGSYCVPMLEHLVRYPDNFYAVVACDDFDPSLRVHRPDVLSRIIKSDTPDKERLICTALTFQDTIAVADLNCALERHGVDELFEAFMRANVRVEGPVDARSRLMRFFHPERFGAAATLLEACRNVVRKCLGVTVGDFGFYAAVRRLGVPQSLKDYIVLKGQL